MGNLVSVWHLIARVLNNEASSEEEQQLTTILRRDESLQQQFDLLGRIWKEKHDNPEFEDKDAAQSIISRIITKAESESLFSIQLPVEKRRSGNRRIWLAAASVLVLVSAGWLFMSKRTSANEPKAEAIEAKKGSRSRSLLPDGTTVWLNAGSKLSYVGDFTGATREVRLEGEAFFDVVKQPDRPFIVHTSGIDIKVLGTAFNVKSYPEEDSVETTLYRGAVKVFREEDSEKKSIELRPNEKLILAKQAATAPEQVSESSKPSPITAVKLPGSFTIAHIDSTKKESERFETAWIYSRLEFRGDSFEDLARKLERWYNVTIVFNDEKVKQLYFNGSFEKETIAQAFAALKSAVPFNYIIKGHEITVGSFNGLIK
ncbi:MAG: FecR domain-containing protein [Chitinophagaceae bacterium]|nr:FecR domain-containing protein [Chitinophagaceae bacterium]